MTIKEAEEEADAVGDTENVDDAYLQQHSYGKAEALREVIAFVRRSRAK